MSGGSLLASGKLVYREVCSEESGTTKSGTDEQKNAQSPSVIPARTVVCEVHRWAYRLIGRLHDYALAYFIFKTVLFLKA